MRIGVGIAIVFFLSMFVQSMLHAPDDNAFACGVKLFFNSNDRCLSGNR